MRLFRSGKTCHHSFGAKSDLPLKKDKKKEKRKEKKEEKKKKRKKEIISCTIPLISGRVWDLFTGI